MFRCGRRAALSRAPRRPRLPWRRPGRLLSPSTLSRPLSDYLHLGSVRHTAGILISSPPPLPSPAQPTSPSAPHPTPASSSWGLIKSCGCIPASVQANRQLEVSCAHLSVQDGWPSCGNGSAPTPPPTPLAIFSSTGSPGPSFPHCPRIFHFLGYVEAGSLRSPGEDIVTLPSRPVVLNVSNAATL